MLLELLLSCCHNCGYKHDFMQKLEAKHYKENMYILSFICPICLNKNEVVASDYDIKKLFKKDEKIS